MAPMTIDGRYCVSLANGSTIMLEEAWRSLEWYCRERTHNTYILHEDTETPDDYNSGSKDFSFRVKVGEDFFGIGTSADASRAAKFAILSAVEELVSMKPEPWNAWWSDRSYEASFAQCLRTGNTKEARLKRKAREEAIDRDHENKIRIAVETAKTRMGRAKDHSRAEARKFEHAELVVVLRGEKASLEDQVRSEKDLSKKLGEKIAKMERVSSELLERCHTLKEKLQAAEQKGDEAIKAVKAEHGATKEELERTKQSLEEAQNELEIAKTETKLSKVELELSKKEFERVQKESASSKEETERVSEELAISKIQTERVSEEMAVSKQENDRLKDELEKLRSAQQARTFRDEPKTAEQISVDSPLEPLFDPALMHVSLEIIRELANVGVIFHYSIEKSVDGPGNANPRFIVEMIEDQRKQELEHCSEQSAARHQLDDSRAQSTRLKAESEEFIKTAEIARQKSKDQAAQFAQASRKSLEEKETLQKTLDEAENALKGVKEECEQLRKELERSQRELETTKAKDEERKKELERCLEELRQMRAERAFALTADAETMSETSEDSDLEQLFASAVERSVSPQLSERSPVELNHVLEDLARVKLRLDTLEARPPA
ncbi:hypothetical protein JCM16303_005539 [Sporobolomyces ruberrimus]